MVHFAVLEQNDGGAEEILLRQIKPAESSEPLESSAALVEDDDIEDETHSLLEQDENDMTLQADLFETEEIPSKPLAFSPTTPCLLTWLIPFLCLATHALFLYGQLEPMWRLTQSQSVDVWYNATGMTAKWAYSTLGLPHDLHVVRDSNSTIQTFTYSFAIKELWKAKGMPGLFVPRLAAVLLALFSGLWPHLKLVLLNLTWLFMRHPTRRTRVLHWLSCLGKWSLADILVVCVMVGVLHIDWYVDPGAIREGVADNMPQLLDIVKSTYTSDQLCSLMLHLDCDNPDSFSNRIKCDACISAVATAYMKPNWTESTGKTILSGIETSGDGICVLRVIGMRGIYAFCGAVVLSILLSLFVDVLDHRAKRAAEYAFLHAEWTTSCLEEPLLLQHDSQSMHEADEDDDDDDDEEEAMLLQNIPDVEQGLQNDVHVNNPSASFTLLEERQPHEEQCTDEPQPTRSHFSMDGGVNEEVAIGVSIRWCSVSHAIFSFLVLILTVFACVWVTFERQVHGAIPMLLHDTLGIVWYKAYSLHTLSRTVGAAGGWDYMLMATFSLFCVFGPILRSSLCVLGHVLPGRLSTIQIFVDLIGAFCGWEVLVIAITMIYLLMPTITNTIIMDDRCKQVDPDGRCFEVDFNVLRTFILILVSGTMLVLISNTFSLFDGRKDRSGVVQQRVQQRMRIQQVAEENR